MEELAPIDEIIKEANDFFERPDVKKIFQDADWLSLRASNYQLGKTLWSSQYTSPHPSKEKRDKLKELDNELFWLRMAINKKSTGLIDDLKAT